MRPDLAALVARYQQQLRLQDWRLDVSYAPNLQTPQGAPAWGLCMPQADAKRAKILIRDPNTPPDGMTPEQAAAQVVETIVHELLHLHFAPFGNVTQEAAVAEENAVWAIAEALIAIQGSGDEALVAARVVDRIAARHPVAAVVHARRIDNPTGAVRAATGAPPMNNIDPDQIARTINLDPLPSKVAQLFGLQPNASPGDIQAALESYETALEKIAALTASGGSTPAVPPAPGYAPPDDTGMTRQQRRICREQGIAPSEFVRVRTAVFGKQEQAPAPAVLTDEQRAICREQKIDPADFLAMRARVGR